MWIKSMYAMKFIRWTKILTIQSWQLYIVSFFSYKEWQHKHFLWCSKKWVWPLWEQNLGASVASSHPPPPPTLHLPQLAAAPPTKDPSSHFRNSWGRFEAVPAPIVKSLWRQWMKLVQEAGSKVAESHLSVDRFSRSKQRPFLQTNWLWDP